MSNSIANTAQLSKKKYSSEEIVDYYDSCEIDYKLVWHLGSNHAMHYGFWDKSTKTLREALSNMNQLIASTAGITNGQKILDAGCGIGGSTYAYSNAFKSEFHGISLSEKQVETARNLVKSSKNKKSIFFSVQDYTKTNYKDEQFDVVFAIESVCHAAEKKDFLKEAFRILKKGGRLVVADFFENKESYSKEDNQLLTDWANSWAVPEFEYINTFIDKTKQVGFSTVEEKEITQNIQKSARRLYYYFYPGWICHKVLSALKIRNNTQEKNLWSTYYQYQALKKQLWTYHIVSATK